MRSVQLRYLSLVLCAGWLATQSASGQAPTFTKILTGIYDPSEPVAMVADPDGNPYILDRGENVLMMRKPDGKTFQVVPVKSGGGLARDASGNLYVATGGKIYKVTSDKKSSVFSETNVGGLSFDAQGNLYGARYDEDTVMRIDKAGKATMLAQNVPRGVTTVDKSGNVYVGSGNTLTRITPQGKAAQIAKDVYFDGITGVAVSPDGRLVVLAPRFGLFYLDLTGKPIGKPVPTPGGSCMAFGPKGELYIGSSGEKALFLLEKK